MTAATSLWIRDATGADLAAINRIYNDAIETTTATWDEVRWTDEKRREWFAEHGPSTPVLVAEVDGAVAGFAYLTLMSQKSGWRFTREDTIYLDPAFHRQGIGRRLLGDLLDRARALDVRLAVATISSDNAASMALHEALGFTFAGQLRGSGYKFDAWRDTIYMTHDLRPGS
jgi:phosphinothricin acetyltransferase